MTKYIFVFADYLILQTKYFIIVSIYVFVKQEYHTVYTMTNNLSTLFNYS